jgi:hypothetical protein
MDGARRLSIQTRRARRLLTLTATLLVAVAAAGCSSGKQQAPAGQAPAAAPAGFATYQGPTYTIAYPTGWQVTQQPTSTGGPPSTLITGPIGPGGFHPIIGVGHDTNYGSEFSDAMELFRTTAIGKAGHLIADQPTKLAGAAKAQRTEYTIQQPGTDGQAYTIHVVELHAITPARTMFDVLVRAPEQSFDRTVLGNALDSFRIGASA